MKTSPIPAGALEADLAIIAQKGAGKTYAMRGLVEQLLKGRRRVVIMDPLNSWWGLKGRPDGSAGYPVAVVGGPNADIPLDATQGEALGTFIAGATMSVVVDVSELKRGEMVRFSIDFLAALYRLNREPLWLVLEEADVFAPQQPMNDAMRLLHEVDQIARRGRARGFRLWSITQRPAKLHKDVLTQTSTLITMRLRSPQDRAAAEAWIQGNTDNARAREIVAELASLPTGEGWVWAPDFDMLERVKFPPIETLDTSATPAHGAARARVGQLAGANIEQLRSALGTSPTPTDKAVSPPPTGQLEVSFAAAAAAANNSYLQGLEEGRLHGHDAGRRQGFAEAIQQTRAGVLVLLDQLLQEFEAAAGERPDPLPAAAPAKSVKSRQDLTQPAPPRGGATLGPSAHKLLEAIRRGAATWSDAAVIAVLAPTGGSYNAARKQLIDGKLAIIDAGALSAVGQEPLPEPDPATLVDAWAAKLGGSAARILRHLFVARGQSKTDIAQDLALAATGGSWNHAWKQMRVNGLVEEYEPGRWRLTAWLQSKKGKSV